jgi:protein ImuB
MNVPARLTRIGCLLLREREDGVEPHVQRALLDLALAHSPRVENAGPGLVYLDLAGLGRLFGSDAEIGRRLQGGAAERGLSVRVGIGGSRACAHLAARWGDGVTIVPPGQEATTLASAPLSLLGCSEDTAALLRRWGLRTLGELAALPATSLHERLGAEGLHLRELARGDDPRPLLPWEPPPVVEESVDLGWEVESFEALIEIVARLTTRACAALTRGELEVDRIEWTCRLADRSEHAGAITPAVPTREPAGVIALVRGALESRRPPAGVTGLTLRVHPVRVPLVQGAFDRSPRPNARALAETLAKLAALVGAGHVGMPMLSDSHRPDATSVQPFPLRGLEGRAAGLPASARGSVLALRRARPPRPAAVRLTGGRPVHVRSDRLAGTIVASAGPWRSSGEWWRETGWGGDEWDVELADGTLCRIGHDGSSWSLEGVYD